MTIKGLDSERRALVKAINKAETELADKEDDLKHLREQILDLEATDEAEEHPVDGTAYVYLGLAPCPSLMGHSPSRSASDSQFTMAWDLSPF